MSLSQVKLIVLDVDGTLTDGGIYVTEDGSQFKKFNAKDGMGIKLMQKAGYEVGIISHSSSKGMIEARSKTLGMSLVYVGQEPKLKILDKWCEGLDISLDQVAYMGDDVNDIIIMEAVGFSACPADAVKGVLKVADVVLSKNGGEGAVREFVDDYLIPSSDNM